MHSAPVGTTKIRFSQSTLRKTASKDNNETDGKIPFHKMTDIIIL